jgi:Trk K+ transport system NAD-binding subunit
MNQGPISIPAMKGHLNLMKLLTSGIPVDLPEDKQLVIVTLNTRSPWIGRSIKTDEFSAKEKEAKIMAILRDNCMHLPHNDIILQSGDQLLLIVTPSIWEKVSQTLIPNSA